VTHTRTSSRVKYSVRVEMKKKGMRRNERFDLPDEGSLKLICHPQLGNRDILPTGERRAIKQSVGGQQFIANLPLLRFDPNTYGPGEWQKL
jgi:hypothetical protein